MTFRRHLSLLLLATSLHGCGSHGSVAELPLPAPSPDLTRTPEPLPTRGPEPLPTRTSDAPIPEPRKATTVLVYLNGSNLEQPNLDSRGLDSGSAASATLQEMMAWPGSDQVNLIVCTGGCNKDAPGQPVRSWKTVKRHQVTPAKLTELQDLGPLDMDDPHTLRDFLIWGERAYPAQRFVAVLWDHGAGYAGFGGDQNTERRTGLPSRMTQPGLAAALQEAQEATGITLDLLGFDACLMASDEIATVLQPVARTLVASEELEPSTSWNYTAWLTTLGNRPTLDRLQLGRAICDSYLSESLQAQKDELTLSVIDLTLYETLRSAMRDLATALAQQLASQGDSAIRPLELARTRTQSFKGNTGTVDLAGWCQQLQNLQVLVPQTRALQQAVARVVSYQVHDEARQGTAGLAFFFPRDWETESYRTLYAANRGLQLQSVVLRIYELVRAQVARVTVTDLNVAPDRSAVSGQLHSQFGVAEVQLVLSSSDPTAPLISYDLHRDAAFQATADQQAAFQAPLPKSRLVWDGHPLPVLPPQSDTAGFSVPALVNGQRQDIELSKRGTTYQVDGIASDDIDDLRPRPLDDNDRVQLLVRSFNRTSPYPGGSAPFGDPFLAGARQVTEEPLRGTYNLLLDIRDLNNNRLLTNQTLPISFP